VTVIGTFPEEILSFLLGVGYCSLLLNKTYTSPDITVVVKVTDIGNVSLFFLSS